MLLVKAVDDNGEIRYFNNIVVWDKKKLNVILVPQIISSVDSNSFKSNIKLEINFLLSFSEKVNLSLIKIDKIVIHENKIYD